MILPENTNSYFPNFIEEEENVIPKQFIIGGDSEHHNFTSSPLHPSGEKLVLTSYVEENSSLLNNKNDNLDILTGEATRKASQVFSNAWNYVQNMFEEEPNLAGEYYPKWWDSVVGRRSFWEVLNPTRTDWRDSDSFQFIVDANTDIQLGVKNPPFPVNVNLVDNKYNILASSGFQPNDFDNPLSYPFLVPGNIYTLEVEYPKGWSVPWATEIVLNMDQAGESFWDARQLGDITGQRIAINDFVGTNKGDFADFYEFSIFEPRSLSYKVHEYDNLIDVEVFNDQGININPNETIIGAFSDKQGAFVHYLPAGNYFAKVSAPINPDLHTNYEVVFNLESPPLNFSQPIKEIDDYTDNYNWRPGGAFDISSIIFHHTATNDAQSVINWFKNPDSLVSAHYVIDKDGTIINMVDTSLRAWHAGISVLNNRTDVNSFSIGIEIVNPDGNIYDYTEKQYQSLEWLTKDLLSKYPSINYLTGHEDVALPKNRKKDPGIKFDWDRIERAATEVNPEKFGIYGYGSVGPLNS